jgi:hypothetical protein
VYNLPPIFDILQVQQNKYIMIYFQPFSFTRIKVQNTLILGWKHIIVAKNCSHKFFFWNYLTFNFHQAIIERGFIYYTQNKVVQ